MTFAAAALAGLACFVAGIVLGCLGARAVLRFAICPRCDREALLDKIVYRCECGETVEEEELP